jgi:V-type H+-transporting ATPase subunit C
MEGKTFWLISAPKTREDTFNTLNKKTADEHDFSVNYKFQVPDLKVGTLDSLMTLSDELHKVDIAVENTTRKIANQLFDISDSNQPTAKYELLTVANNDVNSYLTFFKWDEAKYPTSQALKALTELIQVQVGKLDEELKAKAAEYNNLLHNINAEDRKSGGNLLVKDIGEIVKENHVIETEYMETLFVAVPKTSAKIFLATYEKLVDYVLPRSALLLEEDNDFCLYRVVLFRKFSEDFKSQARERKFIVRDFKFDPNRTGKADKKKMDAEKEKLRKALIRWCKTNFSESFIAWIHLKAIRVFVESVLRYGLPTNFQAMLLVPNKNKDSKLRKALAELYGHLSSKSIFNKDSKDDEDGPEHENFYPYVSLEINLDFRNKSTI